MKTDIVLITQLLQQVDDPQLISDIKELLAKYFGKKQTTDIWEDLTDKEKSFIEKSRAQHNAGEGIPHSDVIKELKQQIGK